MPEPTGDDPELYDGPTIINGEAVEVEEAPQGRALVKPQQPLIEAAAWSSDRGARLLAQFDPTVQRKLQARAMDANGTPSHEIARELDVCKAQVHKDIGPKIDRAALAERRARGIELLKQGKDDVEVAEELGVTRNAVGNWRVAAGLPRNPTPLMRRKERGLAMLRAGDHYLDVARDLDMDPQIVWRWKAGSDPFEYRSGIAGAEPPTGQALRRLGGRCAERVQPERVTDWYPPDVLEGRKRGGLRLPRVAR